MASDEQFSLCWNNFHANMSAGFHGLLSRGDLVDVTLAAEGRLLQAHKLVLSVCSPYFQEMFKMNPTQHPIVFLKDVSHSALRDLLQFMYQGEVNVKQEELASFISTAEQLQVKGLTGNQNEESSTPSKPKVTPRPGPRSSQQRQMTKIETDLDSKPSSTPVAIKRPNRPSIASNNSSSSQSGPAKRKCVDPLEAGPSGSTKEEFVTIPDEDENNSVAPKMEPEFVNESMWDDDDDGTNNDETNFGEDDSNMEMTGFDGSTTGDGNITGEGGAVGDAQGRRTSVYWNYFDDCGSNMVRCKICLTKLHMNMSRHLRFKHPKLYSRLHEFTSTIRKTRIRPRHGPGKGTLSWIKNYCQLIGHNKYQCKLCHKKLRMPVGRFGNMKRHMDKKHPKIVKREVGRNFDFINDITSQADFSVEYLELPEAIDDLQTETSLKESNSDKEKKCIEESHENDGEDSTESDVELQMFSKDKIIQLCKKDQDEGKSKKRSSWVWNFFERLGNKLRRCIFCKRKLSVSDNSTGNLIRHIKTKHISEYSIIMQNVPRNIKPPQSETMMCENFVKIYFDAAGSDSFKCNFCEEIFEQSDDIETVLFNHIKETHPEEVVGFETQETENDDDEFSVVIVRKKDLQI